jgi:drug/metabolite transporter (DMT)-like permease
MPIPYLGEILAIIVSFCWAASSSAFEAASLRVGSLQVNFLRLLMAFVMLGLYGLLARGSFFPDGANSNQWLWLSISGMVGFFIGDLFLFKSLAVIGARMTMLVMTFSPALTAIISLIFLGEALLWNHVAGILLIVVGILMAFLGKKDVNQLVKISLKGLLLALGGAFGQALGLVFSKRGIGDYDPFAATQIRIIAGFFFFALLVTVLRRWPKMFSAMKDTMALKHVAVGSFFGPGLGVGLSMAAIALTGTGIASALMSMTPIVLVGYALIRRKRVSTVEIIGSFVSVSGVLLLFLG